jgi:cell division protease FtsH
LDKKVPQTQKQNPLAKIILWFLSLWLLSSFLLTIYGPSDSKNVPYTDFKKKVSEGKISKVVVKEDQMRGIIRGAGKPSPTEGSGQKEYDYIHTVRPPFEDPELIELLEKNHVVLKAEPAGRSWLESLFITLLPWVLIIGFFVYMGRKAQERMGGMGGPGGVFGFGKSKARLYTKENVTIGFKDVAGLPGVKKELQEIVEYLKSPDRFRTLGGELPKGILLIGPPGTGKTLLARATAGEADVPFYSISGSEFIEMFVGVGASRVRDMFDKAKKGAPSIIFVDEIDSIGRVRGTGLGGGHDEREQTLNQILAEMDGFAPHESVIVLAATNRPDVLDPALIRPGRFDRRVTLDLPQRRARKEILELHTADVPLGKDVDLHMLAGGTAGFSGADLKNLVNEAALLAARKGKKEVEAEDFDQAVDKVRMGIEREDLINEEEKRLIAFHEAGHALTAKLLPGADPLKKVSIIPRGRSLGATEQIPEEERHNLSRLYLMNRMAIMLGGRAAEKMIFDDVTSGGADDLKKATEMARRMVCQWGMSEKLGPVTFRRGEPHPFLGREMAEPRDFSEQTARIIDEEIQKMTLDMENRAREILESNRESLETLAEALLEHETLDNEEINQLIGMSDELEDDEEESNKGGTGQEG